MLKLADNEKPPYIVAKFVNNNFGMLPEDVRNNLLLNLAGKDNFVPLYVALHVFSIVVQNYKKLLENVRNLIFELARNENLLIY